MGKPTGPQVKLWGCLKMNYARIELEDGQSKRLSARCSASMGETCAFALQARPEAIRTHSLTGARNKVLFQAGRKENIQEKGKQYGISITIYSPGSGAIANENLDVTAQVTSTYQLQSVQALVEDRTNQLVFSSPNWTGTLSLAGLACGGKVLTVVATDVFGNSNQVQRSFVYDLPPTLIVTTPPNGTVARSSLHLIASAQKLARTKPKPPPAPI